LKRGPHEQWCLPNVDADLVAAMEDVLDLYAQPYDPTAPLVCFECCAAGGARGGT